MTKGALNLEVKVSAYEKALDDLSLESARSESRVRSLFLARDGVARELRNAAEVTEQAYGRIAELDKRLKVLTKVINDVIGEKTFISWREVNQPPEAAWWWFLDKRAVENAERDNETGQKRNALWIILTALLVSISLGFIVEISKRFLSGGRDWVSVVNTIVQTPLIIVQAALGLLAAGTLTDPGRQWAETLLTKVGLYKSYGVKKRVILAAAIFALVLGVRLSLPRFARFYIERANANLVQNDQSKAMENYQRAMSLDPDSARAHYSAGTVYENLHNYDDAINEYRAAVALDNKFLEAQNNLARLYLWRGKDKDFENALQILNDALNQSPSERDVRYVLLKNRGWANFELKHYTQAENDLRQALQIDQNRPRRTDDSSDRAAPHCLLAYVMEATNKGGAMDEWEDCLSYSSGEEDLKAEWISTAKSRLTDGGK
jgi:tetratricopeptide (TPR) repeat protein